VGLEPLYKLILEERPAASPALAFTAACSNLRNRFMHARKQQGSSEYQATKVDSNTSRRTFVLSAKIEQKRWLENPLNVQTAVSEFTGKGSSWTKRQNQKFSELKNSGDSLSNNGTDAPSRITGDDDGESGFCGGAFWPVESLMQSFTQPTPAIPTGVNLSVNTVHQLLEDMTADDSKTVTPQEAGIDAFALTSKGDALHTIYLDFNGHTTANTDWNDTYNDGKNFTTPAFSMDGSSSFSTAETARILNIWRRVAEDFRPFDVNVTTKAPSINDLRKSNANDQRWGIRVVVGGLGNQWLGQSGGGIAFLDSFNFASDTPAYIFSAEFDEDETNVSEAISHETGHTLGLIHDGRNTPAEEYYAGHGTGVTGWAPIMGVGYYQTLTQWSKGQYGSASNPQDDLKIITTENGFGYRKDDHGNSVSDDTIMTLNSNNFVGSGIIDRSNDVDFFSFGVQTSGRYQINVSPFFKGPNLDVAVRLYDGQGSLLKSFNPQAEINVATLQSFTPGQYFLRVNGVGLGDPATTGYSDYGSLGQYNIRIIPKDIDVIVPTVQIFQQDAAKTEGNSGTMWFTFRLLRQNNLKIQTIVNYQVSGVTSGNSVDRFDFVGDQFASGTATFEFGKIDATLSIAVKGDSVWEKHERLQVTISNAVNGRITKNTVVGTIFNDDQFGGGALAAALPTIPNESLQTRSPSFESLQASNQTMVSLELPATSRKAQPSLVTSNQVAALSALTHGEIDPRLPTSQSMSLESMSLESMMATANPNQRLPTLLAQATDGVAATDGWLS